ncbi:MAG: 2-amino-4-hydroxy-6-hydroxymethyldihydropteridine diphosphokinase [Calditrichaeota bacterium]|nr:2-amino-4-hydroxy-6-hydroxymethyldihydropteridine diphosphokinase [Calditrichota bacterium]
MPDVFLALGSNIEPREDYLRRAVDQLNQLGMVKKLAPIYETTPYGKTDQPLFLNTALILDTALVPTALLHQLKQLEVQLGRRHRERWGPREIDLDIIFYDQLVIQTPELVIPHPDYQNRRFVLQPLTDIAPRFIAPDAGEPLKTLLSRCPDTTRMRLYKNEWVTDEHQH